MNDSGFPVFDADNHLYESPAWLDPCRSATPDTSND